MTLPMQTLHGKGGENSTSSSHSIISGSGLRFLANVNSRSRSLYVCRLSVCRLPVTFVHPTQTIGICGNFSTPLGTLPICNLSIKILRRSSQGNPSVGGLNRRGKAKYSDFGRFQGYILETVQDRR